MAKRRFDEVIKLAMTMFVNRNMYTYFYGAKGQLLTDAVMNALWNAEPAYFARYTAQEKAEIFKNARGKYGFDCSGFVGRCTGDQQWSTGQIGNSVKNVSIAAGPEASILYTTYKGTGRHIGLDIGKGFFLHSWKEPTNKNIANGEDGIQLWKISDGRVPWEVSAKSNMVDYIGASSL